MIVKIKYADFWKGYRGQMEINLAEICKLEGKRFRVDDEPPTYKVLLPLPKVKKIFRLIVKNCDADTIEQVQSYIEQNSKTFGEVFRKILEKSR